MKNKSLIIIICFFLLIQTSFGCMLIFEGTHIYLDKSSINPKYIGVYDNYTYTYNDYISIKMQFEIQKDNINIYSYQSKKNKYLLEEVEKNQTNYANNETKETLNFLVQNNYIYLTKEDLIELNQILNTKSTSEKVYAKLPTNKFWIFESKKSWQTIPTNRVISCVEFENKFSTLIRINNTPIPNNFLIILSFISISLIFGFFIKKIIQKKKN